MGSLACSCGVGDLTTGVGVLALGVGGLGEGLFFTGGGSSTVHKNTKQC